MASTKQNDVSKPGPPDVSRVQGLNLNHPKIESFSGISDENDRNSNLSPSKSADPSRKKMFKITSVKKGGGGTGDVGGDNDADSVDGLDESQTEDISSEFYDSSKATDLDMDLQDCMNIPLTPDEVTSTTTIVVKQKPDQNSQSRFKVVKIETKEPFRRGKWVCYDFFDTAPASVVMVEKNDSKATEDSVIQSALSGNLSLSSSVHYVQDVNDSSSNIFIPPVVSPARNDGHHMPSDAFVPIQPAPASQVLNQLDGLSSDIMAPFIAQQVLMSVAGVPSSSNSFHNLAQPGHTTIIQNLPHNNIFPYAQNGPPVGLYQNGVTAGQTSEVMSLPADAMIAAVGSGAPTLIATAAPAVGSSSIVHSQAFPIVSAVQVPHSLSQTQIAGDTIVSQGVPPVIETAPSTVLGPGIPSSMAHVPHSRTDTVAATTSLEVGEQMGPAMSESTDSIKTLQGDTDGQASEGLKEAVEAVGEMYMGLEGNEEDQDERTNELAAMLSMLPLGGPSALPLHLDHRNLDSPFGYSLTPVRSLCASPVPISFLEHFDPVVSVTGMFPARVTTPTHAVFVPPSSAGFIEPVYNPPAIPAPTSFPHSESFVPPSYFPAPQPLVFSVTSAFVPMGISGASVVEPSSVSFSTAGSVSAPATMLKSCALVSMSQSMSGIPSLSTSHTAKIDRVSMMSSLSPDGSSRPVSPLMLVHPISTSSPVMENPGYATSKMPSMDDGGRAAGQNAGSICEYFDDSALPSYNQKPPEDDSGGGSTVAIDNKIEQAMDLVKRHLMYAVREEVEILKQQIGEMMERIGQLEYENTVLRSEARPETLNKLLQPRVVTSSQPAVPGQATPMLVTPAPQQTPAQPPSQPQPSLQTTHPPSQQHLSQTTTAQAPQPPPSTSSS